MARTPRKRKKKNALPRAPITTFIISGDADLTGEQLDMLGNALRSALKKILDFDVRTDANFYFRGAVLETGDELDDFFKDAWTHADTIGVSAASPIKPDMRNPQ